MPEFDVIGIGSTVYDTLMVIDRYPKEDTKLRGLETRIQGGGPCATALVAASRLGLSAAYMGTIGDDTFGRYMLDDLNRLGVDTSNVRVEHGAVSFHSTVLLNQKTASRTCIWNPGTVQPPRPELLNTQALTHTRALHLDGHMTDAAVFAAKLCCTHGIPVFYDAGGVYPGIEDLLPHVTHLIPSEEFALKLTGAQDAERAASALMEQYRQQVVVITQGSRGGLILDGQGLRRYDCYPGQVVDSKRVIAAVAGDCERAHEAGCALCGRLNRAEPVVSDIAVTSNGGYPLDQNLYQSVKGMTAAEACVRQGGVIIMCAALGDGHGGESFFRWFADRPDAQTVAADIESIPPGETRMDQWEAQILARVMLRATCIIVTGEENRALVEQMHLRWAPDADAALAMAEDLVGADATVTVIPNGVGVIL